MARKAKKNCQLRKSCANTTPGADDLATQSVSGLTDEHALVTLDPPATATGEGGHGRACAKPMPGNMAPAAPAVVMRKSLRFMYPPQPSCTSRPVNLSRQYSVGDGVFRPTSYAVRAPGNATAFTFASARGPCYAERPCERRPDSHSTQADTADCSDPAVENV